MSNSHRRTKADANRRLPEELTQIAIDGILSLPEISHKVKYLKETFLSKFVSKETDPAGLRQMRAIRKWLSVEEQNDATSTRLLTYPAYHNILPGVTREDFESTVRDFIHDVIGDTPDWSSLAGGFSGGASTSRKKGKSFPSMKYLGEAHVTHAAQELFDLIKLESPVWCDLWSQSGSSTEVIKGNVMFTVPKTAEIDRCACKEPDFNMYIQRGIGLQIRQSLRRVGINLNDQSINQSLARKGSIDGSLATLDLSSASDSVTKEVVDLLFPPVWAGTMSQVRSPYTWVPEVSSWHINQDGGYTKGDSTPGFWHKNHMLSSMGNGFTFEVESLLFYALARATAFHRGVRGRISVYGDDIIVPTAIADYLIYVLEFYGFSINTDKSFTDGHFRESCGGHYYMGDDVSPFYIRAPIERLTDLIRFLNQLRDWDCRDGVGVITEPLWQELARHVPKAFWNGHDCSNQYVLVSPYTRGCGARLMPHKNKVSRHDGEYLQWLDSREDSDGLGSSQSVLASTGSKCELRRRPAWDMCYRTSRLYYGDVAESFMLSAPLSGEADHPLRGDYQLSMGW